MANLTPVNSFDDVIQLETTDIAIGGAGGIMNAQAQALLNRTAYLNSALANKLDASAYMQHYRGKFVSLVALETAIPTGSDGDYAIVDTGAGNDAVYYIWDVQDGWVSGGTISGSTTDDITEGASNLYFNQSRVLATSLTGLDLSTNAVIGIADSVLSALGKLQKQITDLISNQRYQFVSDASTTYTVPASAVTENGRTIIELSNNSLTSITINAATGTGKTLGDSVNISITGTYTAQTLAADGVTLQGDLTFSYQYQTKTLVYKGSDVWKVVG